MRQEAIVEVDRAALELIKALDKYAAGLKTCVKPEGLENLRADLESLRQTLLGLEFGYLYGDWDAPEDVLEDVICSVGEERISVEVGAARVAHRLKEIGHS